MYDLKCARCLIDGRPVRPSTAVTVMGGDALCSEHALLALALRRSAEQRLAQGRTRREAREKRTEAPGASR